ncbi:MAG TPA: XdhC family protein [Solirubrobacterales bacterium]|nr:XdhC family protein [Solirubrobacterales bacterium]
MLSGELAAIAREELIPRGVPFVEATVVRAQSPASVRAGDAALVRPDGTIEGFVGGECAEASVRLHALRVLETGEPLLLRILPGEEESEQPAAEGSVMVKNPCLSGGGLEIFLEPHLPAAILRVIGDSPIAGALADLGRGVGFAVEAKHPGEGAPGAGASALIVASHGHDETAALTDALREGVPYVGLVASRTRGEAVREALDVPADLRSQLRTPAGFDIGARSPEEIALSILAEIVAVRRSRGVPATADASGAGSFDAERENPAADAPRPAAGGRPSPAAPPVAIDPICGMEVAVTGATIQLERDGERHYFCSEGCRDRFVAQGAPGAGVR